MIRIVCDRCGRDANWNGTGMRTNKQGVGHIMLGVNATPLENERADEITLQDTEFGNCHFCLECMAEIREFIRSKPRTGSVTDEPPKNAPEPSEDVSKLSENVSKSSESMTEPKKMEQKSRKRIDVGKIMALRKAGWSVREIADEMGMQPQSVSNAIWQYKRKHEDAE